MPSIDLTTLAIAKQLLSLPDDVTDKDDKLDQLIDEVSDDIEKRCHRQFKEQAYTRYYDGTGRDVMLLDEGPLVSVTSVESVEYGDDAGSRTETLTAIDQSERLEGGLRSEGHKGLGHIRMLSGEFTEGKRNYKVVFTAGFATTTASLPGSLIGAATRRVAALFKVAPASGLLSDTHGSSDITPIPMANLDAALMRDIERFIVKRVG